MLNTREINALQTKILEDEIKNFESEITKIDTDKTHKSYVATLGIAVLEQINSEKNVIDLRKTLAKLKENTVDLETKIASAEKLKSQEDVRIAQYDKKVDEEKKVSLGLEIIAHNKKINSLQQEIVEIERNLNSESIKIHIEKSNEIKGIKRTISALNKAYYEICQKYMEEITDSQINQLYRTLEEVEKQKLNYTEMLHQEVASAFVSKLRTHSELKVSNKQVQGWMQPAVQGLILLLALKEIPLLTDVCALIVNYLDLDTTDASMSAVSNSHVYRDFIYNQAIEKMIREAEEKVITELMSFSPKILGIFSINHASSKLLAMQIKKDHKLIYSNLSIDSLINTLGKLTTTEANTSYQTLLSNCKKSLTACLINALEFKMPELSEASLEEILLKVPDRELLLTLLDNSKVIEKLGIEKWIRLKADLPLDKALVEKLPDKTLGYSKK